MGLPLMLWSSGRGYPERRGFPREEKTPARGLVRRRETLGLAPDIQREYSGISLTLVQSQTPAPDCPHPWEAETGRAGCTQVRLPHHRAVGSLTYPPLLQSPPEGPASVLAGGQPWPSMEKLKSLTSFSWCRKGHCHNRTPLDG